MKKRNPADETRIFDKGRAARQTMPCHIPGIGAVIIINERIYSQNPGRNSCHLYRGCVLVQGETEHLLICKEQRTPDYQCTITFKKSDFLRGMLHYKEIQEPMYTCSTSWKEFSLDLIG